MKKTSTPRRMGFQLISRNAQGEIVACFTEPYVPFWWAAEVQDKLGGYDPAGRKLEIIVC